MNFYLKLTRRTLMQMGATSIATGVLSCSNKNGHDDPQNRIKKPIENEKADTVILGGTIVTMDPSMPRADAIALKGNKILAVGKLEEVNKLKTSNTEIIDLQGGIATPGLVDAHGHVVSLGKSLEEVNLRGSRSINEVIERIKEHGPVGSWIRGRGWDQNLWEHKKMPSHKELSKAFPDRPVWLGRVDGHAGWGNTALLEVSGITSTTTAPAGGEILRDEAGNPTGVLVDTAMDLVPAPVPTRDDIRRRILKTQKHLLERGITGAHDMGISETEDAVYRELADSKSGTDKLNIRILGYASDSWFMKKLRNTKPDRPISETVYNLSGVKTFADGALGSRGAYMLEPYSDRAGHRGLLVKTQAELNDLCLAAMTSQWQVATHAIGDAGNRTALNAYSHAIKKTAVKDHRFRVEHCQIMNLDDIPRFNELSVIASMQPTHATSDMPWVESRIGKSRLPGAYAWRRFLNSGAHVCFGSDFPVEQVDITFGLHAAVSRQDKAGQPGSGWLPDQKLTLDEALYGFTVEPAYAAKRESHLGVIKEGFQADITCFKQNIFNIPVPQLRNTPILATIVGGQILYRV